MTNRTFHPLLRLLHGLTLQRITIFIQESHVRGCDLAVEKSREGCSQQTRQLCLIALPNIRSINQIVLQQFSSQNKDTLEEREGVDILEYP